MCDCIKELDAKLSEHNAAIVCTLFGSPSKVCIETYGTKKGARKPPKVLASFCPFCGVKYEPSDVLSSLRGGM